MIKVTIDHDGEVHEFQGDGVAVCVSTEENCNVGLVGKHNMIAACILQTISDFVEKCDEATRVAFFSTIFKDIVDPEDYGEILEVIDFMENNDDQ